MSKWKDYTIEIEFDGYPGDEVVVNELNKFEALRYWCNHIYNQVDYKDECKKITFVVKEKEL